MSALQNAGLVADCLLVAVAVAAPRPRVRGLATVAVLAGTAGLLLSDLSDTGRLHAVTRRPALAVAGGLLVLVVVAGAAVLAHRRPALVAVAAVAAMPFRVGVGIAGESGNLLVPLYGVIAAGALASAVRELGGERALARRRLGALEWLLLGYVILYALQAAYSSDTTKALEQVVFFYVPFALLFKLLTEIEWTPRIVRSCLALLAGLGLLFCAVGFVQYATRTVWVNDKLKQGNAYTTYFRVNSLFYDPNIYGRFLMVAMLAVTAAVLWSSRRRAVPAGAAVLAVLWAGLLTTRSESSLLALVVGLAILLVLRADRGQLGRAAGLLVAGAAIAAIAIAAITGNSSLRKATSGRNDLLSGGVRLFTARPVLGWGSGSFAHQYELHHDAPSARAVAASHTIPVTVAAEQGVIGLAVYLALLLACFRVVLRAARTSPARAAVAAAFGALVVHTLLYAAFLEDPLTWILLAAGLALPLEPAAEHERVAAHRSSSDAAAFSPSSR